MNYLKSLKKFDISKGKSLKPHNSAQGGPFDVKS